MTFDDRMLYDHLAEMTPQERQLVDLLETLEPAMIRAGQLARSMQATIKPEMKAQSGNIRTDVVTAADRAVQGQILSALIDTRATACQLLAEETPTAGTDDLRPHFAAQSNVYLTVDPIDGTSRYTRNLPYYSTIVGLHNDSRPLYTFIYYPAFDWWVRVSDRAMTMSGPAPVDIGGLDLSRTVVYTAGDPEKDIPEVAAQLREKGGEIRFGESIGDFGSKYLYLSGHAGGYFGGSPNLYDGLFALHCALTRGNTILARGGDGGVFDLSRWSKGPYGMYHPGWYLVVPSALRA